jgi:pimeloyl-ACP methyl ester carboxylesterase
MPVVGVNGVELYYEVRGSGPAILGVHGTPSAAVLWVDAATRLAALGRCIVYDRRGFHRSPPPAAFESVDLDDHVADAAALLTALAAAPAVVVGRSTGGLVALALALRHPEQVQALVLLEAAVTSLHPSAGDFADRLRRRVLHAPPERAGEVVVRDALGDEVWDMLPEELQQLFADASPAVLAELRGTGLDLSEAPFDPGPAELAGLALPVLLVTAEDSLPALRHVNERLAAALPAAEAVTVPGGHLIDPAHPAVLDFVARQLRTARHPSG